MPLDPNIILGSQQTPLQNPMDIAQKGMSLKQMSLQNQALEKQTTEQNTMNDILRKNTITDSQGNISINRKTALSDLYKVNPQRAMEFQKQLQAQDLNKLSQDTAVMKQFAFSSTPETWASDRQKLIQMGVNNAEKLPEQFLPEFQKRLQISTLNGEEQLKNQIEQQKLGLEERKVKVQEKEAAHKMEVGSSEGRKAVDKDYAKDYNDFTGGGQTKAVDAIQKLKDMKNEIAKDTGMVQAGGGPISGSLPDMVRTQASIARRDNIVSVANSALKATFGGQLSDGERKALANEFYNDKLDNAQNLKIIDRKISELEHGLENQAAKAAFFEKRGTLKGFEGIKSSPKETTKVWEGITYKMVGDEWVPQ